MHDGGILISPTTVFRMQVYRLLTQPVVLKEVVEHTYDGVRALPHVDSLVNEVVHLSGKGLTTHTEDGALSGCHGVHEARLLWIISVKKNLLCHVKTVVGRDRCGVCWSLMLVVEGRRWHPW